MVKKAVVEDLEAHLPADLIPGAGDAGTMKTSQREAQDDKVYGRALTGAEFLPPGRRTCYRLATDFRNRPVFRLRRARPGAGRA